MSEKSEKEKMITGDLYYAGDPVLCEDRNKAHYLCAKLNKMKLDNPNGCTPQEMVPVLRDMGMKFDEEHPPYIEPSFFCDYGYNISLGKSFYSNFNCTFLDCAPITIGDNCFMACNVQLYTAAHPLDFKTRGNVNYGLEFAKPITIGDNCWLGGGVIVVPGVRIGNGVVVGAGSVVTKDVPDNVVVAGNPARIIKKIEQ